MEGSFNPTKGCDSQVENHRFSGSFPYLAGTHSSLVCCVSIFERMRLGYNPLPNTIKRGGE